MNTNFYIISALLGLGFTISGIEPMICIKTDSFRGTRGLLCFAIGILLFALSIYEITDKNTFNNIENNPEIEINKIIKESK